MKSDNESNPNSSLAAQITERLNRFTLEELERLVSPDKEKNKILFVDKTDNKKTYNLTSTEFLNEKKLLEDRILIIHLRNIINDDYWDNDVGSFFSPIPDSIKQYRKILNSDMSDSKKIVQITKTAHEKAKKDDEYVTELDNLQSVNNKKVKYGYFKMLVGRSMGVKYRDDTTNSVLSREEVLTQLKKTHSEIYPNYKKDKEVLATLKELVDDRVFWSDKGEKDNNMREDDHDFTPDSIKELRKILVADNRIAQQDKIKAIQSVIEAHATSKKTYPSSSLENENDFLNNISFALQPVLSIDENEQNIAITTLRKKDNQEQEDAQKSLIALNEKRKKIAEQHNPRNSGNLVASLVAILKSTHWDKLGDDWVGKKTPQGIKDGRDILANKNLRSEEKLEKFFMLMHAKVTESSGSRMFKGSQKPQVAELYKDMDALSKLWHGDMRKNANVNVDSSVESILKKYSNSDNIKSNLGTKEPDSSQSAPKNK